MDKEKIIVALLLITIILSVASVLINLQFDSENVGAESSIESPVNKGNIGLGILETPENTNTGT